MRKKQNGIPPVDLKHSLLMFALAMLLLLILHFLVPDSGIKTAYSASEAPKEEIIPSKYRNALQRLAMCESGDKEAIKVMDSNHQYSYGTLQFQLGTFKGFGIQYGLISKDIEDKEVENLIYNKALQFKIAYRMMKDGLASFHWKVCSKKLNLL